jgi:hypothetical protein
MTDRTTKSKSIAQSVSGESQPHQPNHEISLRLRRKRPSPDNDITPISFRKASSQSRRSPSVRSDSSGPHQRESRKRPPTMPSSSTSTHSGLLSPKFTKTGRVSKAKKGVKGAHVCTCGKVSVSSNLLHMFPEGLVIDYVGAHPAALRWCSTCHDSAISLYHRSTSFQHPILTISQVYSRAEHLRYDGLKLLTHLCIY